MKLPSFQKYFEFDRKIGWSQLVSVLALVVSLCAFWLTYSKSSGAPSVSKDFSIGGRFFDKAQKLRLFGYERLVIANNGGSAITLVGLRASREGPFAGKLASFFNDGKLQDVRCEILIVDEFFYDIQNSPDILPEMNGWPMEKLGSLYRLIPAGGTTSLNIVQLYDAYNGSAPVADYIFTSFELYFSDGTTHQFQVASEVR